MRLFLLLLGLGYLLLAISACDNSANKQTDICPDVPAIKLTGKMCGMSLTAPRDPFVQDPMAEMAVLGLDWVALLPYGIFDTTHPDVIRPETNFTWWGETTAGISESHRLAKAQGIKVMLKPQLWSWQQWIGDLDMQDSARWDTFHASYTKFICRWAKLADSLNVDLFCIGTEVKQSAMYFPDYWRGLIDTVRQIYSGELTYAPNWDEYEQVTFWDKLDYIGVDAYFSLLPGQTPRICNLVEAWEPIVQKLEAFSNQWNKPMIFTEWGYLTLDGCAFETWNLEKNRSSAGINQVAQANAMHALLVTFGKKSWWKGGFQWKWYSDLATSGRDRSDDYTPQGKIAEDILKQFYLP